MEGRAWACCSKTPLGTLAVAASLCRGAGCTFRRTKARRHSAVATTKHLGRDELVPPAEAASQSLWITPTRRDVASTMKPASRAIRRELLFLARWLTS